jgi:hypothetical protein
MASMHTPITGRNDEDPKSRIADCYCERMAGILSVPEARTRFCGPEAMARFKSALTPQERLDLFGSEKLQEPKTSVDKPDDLAQRVAVLARILRQSPRLQSIAASCTNYTPSVWLLEQELRARDLGSEICKESGCSHAPKPSPCFAAVSDVYEAARKTRSSGLCLSGGGIRSATFNLGVLQGLAALKLLPRFNYLSSVSGGGYIHQFLASWLRNLPAAALPENPGNAPQSPLDLVQEQLKPLPQELTPDTDNLTEQPGPIRWLRRYSNYLTPRTGIFSTDTWVMIAIWMRNVFLNQIVLVATLATVLCVPHFFTGTSWSWKVLRPHYVGTWWLPWGISFPYALPSLLTAVLWILVIWRTVRLLRDSRFPSEKKPHGRWVETILSWHAVSYLLLAIAVLVSPAVYRAVFTEDPSAVQGAASPSASPQKTAVPPAPGCELQQCDQKTSDMKRVLPSKAEDCAYCTNPGHSTEALSQWFAHYSYPRWLGWKQPGFSAAVVFLLFLGIFNTVTAVTAAGMSGETPRKIRYKVRAWAVVSGFISAAVGWAALHCIRLGLFMLYFFVPFRLFAPIAVVLLPCLLISTVFLAQVVSAGIMGNLTDDALRENMARLRALASCVTLCWIAFTGFSLLGPALVQALTAGYLPQILSLSWIGTTLGSVFAGRSSKTASAIQDSSSKLRWLVLVGPPVFVVGLLLLIATGVQWCISTFCQDTNLHFLLGMTAVFFVVALLFGFRLDINDFSMHAFYRNRIARCYAGASSQNRRPDRFTGLARTDSEVRVADLLPHSFSQGEPLPGASKAAPANYSGPFPIFCTTVNLSFGQDLAWQERKGASFAFTPLYSGYSVSFTSEHLLKGQPKYTYNGFAPTASYAYEDGGIHMHSAVAISGAAVSPNWGYHTNPAMAFLLTMFDVRLGWWIKNPRLARETGWTRPASPPFPLWNLLSELMGRATDTEPYVYLTDGGHFDNMGLYELVRRRCRRILICDAEQDGKNTFEGIGMAIRKARVDYGVEINLDLRKLDPRILDPSIVPPASVAPCHYVKGTIRYPEDKWNDYGEIVYIKASITGDEPGDVLNYKREHDEFPHESTTDQWFTESQFESYRRLGYHIILGNEPKAAPLCEVLREIFGTDPAWN